MSVHNFIFTNPINLNLLYFTKMKVAELKKELADRSLPTKGNKSELQARLERCLSEQGKLITGCFILRQ